ncbi:hypothetical protein [Acidovorax sp. RAC01]|uniref:hypothetical protein n=1 Tax=Acidovorax sp. RAC01 TaxID=1842533 RepID=UPI00085841FD|nr:hypothetical protein [Acidovorax sp. RAC01]AOG25050.1 hypothetical protein BSY15_427 [Acidovorax sp. RAC01]
MTEPRNPAPPDDSAFGVLRIKAGQGGGAVRLATLVRDLMKRHQMARADAVLTYLLPPLSESNAPVLYLLQPGGNAQPLGEREWFGTPDGNPGKKPQAGRVVRSRGIGYAPTNIPMADSVGRGLVGALAWLNRVWGNPAYADAVCMDALYLSAVASRLAVSELDAAEVWGWGSAENVFALEPAVAPLLANDLATWADLVRYRTENTTGKGSKRRGPDWGLGKQIAIAKAELGRRIDMGMGESAALNAMGRELGYTGDEPRKQLHKALFSERKRVQKPMPATVGTDQASAGVIVVRSGKVAAKKDKAA